jgi:hypothetical protein
MQSEAQVAPGVDGPPGRCRTPRTGRAEMEPSMSTTASAYALPDSALAVTLGAATLSGLGAGLGVCSVF